MSTGIEEYGSPPPAPRSGNVIKARSGAIIDVLSRLLACNPIWALLLVCIFIFSVGSPDFLSSYNISNVLFQTALLGFLAVGLTPLMICGKIDLSVGATTGLAACIVVGLESAWGIAIAVPAAIMVGAAIGFINGILVEKTGVNSFIVTLAGMIGIRGIAFLYTGDTSVSPKGDLLLQIANLALGPFGAFAVLLIILVIAFEITLRHTIHGRNTYAIGGNSEAARDTGIPVTHHVVVNFMLAGGMAAIAGIAMSASLGAATASYGREYELWAIIAAVLGGTRLRGGAGTIAGTLAAVLTLTVLRNGLALMSVPPFYEPMVLGSALIIALLIDKQFRRSQRSEAE